MHIANAGRGYRTSLLGGLVIVLLATIAFSGGLQRSKAAMGADAQLVKPVSVPHA